MNKREAKRDTFYVTHFTCDTRQPGTSMAFFVDDFGIDHDVLRSSNVSEYVLQGKGEIGRMQIG